MVQIVLPILYAALGIYLTNLQSDTSNDPAMLIDPEQYETHWKIENVYTYINHTGN